MNPIVSRVRCGQPTFENAAVAAGVAVPRRRTRLLVSLRQRRETQAIADTQSTAMHEAPRGLPAASGSFVKVDISVGSGEHPWRRPISTYSAGRCRLDAHWDERLPETSHRSSGRKMVPARERSGGVHGDVVAVSDLVEPDPSGFEPRSSQRRKTRGTGPNLVGPRHSDHWVIQRGIRPSAAFRTGRWSITSELPDEETLGRISAACGACTLNPP